MNELDEITRQLLRFSPDALIVVDDGGSICFANETVTVLFGYTPAALTGKPLSLLIPERLRGRHHAHVAHYAQAPDSREMGARIADLFARRADGSEFAAAIRLAPIRVGQRLFVAAAIRDATESRRINEELVEAREEADRANRAKSRFLATASHDLRQPLQSIRLLNAAMLKLLSQPEARELLRQQGQAIESMTRLLNALLDIGRLESGTVEPQCMQVPIAELLEELRIEFAALARTRQIGLHFQATDLVVATDRILFYQLLQNLLGNALKYTDQGTVDILCESGPDALLVCIQDTGVGIPADKLEHIFDEYYQIDTHGTRRMGVGLGLAIVKEAARLLGFSVRITSQPGRGTQAYISIPNRYVVTQPQMMRQAPAQPASDAPRRSRLLLVEDNEGVRLATQMFLKLEGYDTLSARSSADAQALFCSLRDTDVVIADYHLDGQHNGLDLLLALRQRAGRDVPGIVLSGDLQAVLRSIRSPIANCRFLSKPVDTTALLDAIHELSTGLPGVAAAAAQAVDVPATNPKEH